MSYSVKIDVQITKDDGSVLLDAPISWPTLDYSDVVAIEAAYVGFLGELVKLGQAKVAKGG